LSAALALVRGEAPVADGVELRDGEVRETLLERSELLPDADGYMAVALGSIARRVAGSHEEPWSLGAG
jgi:hypothetical protein